jgi:hypothetical protein
LSHVEQIKLLKADRKNKKKGKKNIKVTSYVEVASDHKSEGENKKLDDTGSKRSASESKDEKQDLPASDMQSIKQSHSKEIDN